MLSSRQTYVRFDEQSSWSTAALLDEFRSGVHAVQLELAMRGYLEEPTPGLGEGLWPPPYEPARAAGLIRTLRRVVEACAGFVRS